MIFATLVSMSKVMLSGNGRRPLELETVEKVATKEEEGVGEGNCICICNCNLSNPPTLNDECGSSLS